MKTSPLITNTHTLDTSRTPMKKNTSQCSMKNYTMQGSTTGSSVSVPYVRKEMIGIENLYRKMTFNLLMKNMNPFPPHYNENVMYQTSLTYHNVSPF